MVAVGIIVLLYPVSILVGAARFSCLNEHVGWCCKCSSVCRQQQICVLTGLYAYGLRSSVRTELYSVQACLTACHVGVGIVYIHAFPVSLESYFLIGEVEHLVSLPYLFYMFSFHELVPVVGIQAIAVYNSHVVVIEGFVAGQCRNLVIR